MVPPFFLRHRIGLKVTEKENTHDILAIRTIVWNENPLLVVSVDRDDKMSLYPLPRGHGVEVDDTPFRRRCSC